MTCALLLQSFLAYGSALVHKDEKNAKITVISHFIYSGQALTHKIADDSTFEIESMWNESGANIVLNGKNYDVDFRFDYSLKGLFLFNKKSCAYNFIQVLDKTNPADRSFYSGLGSQRAVFYTSDQLGTSTTAAHEFGHGLMLEHDDFDQLDQEIPGIMFARGTLVKPEYQWNTSALPGEYGGSINPKYRKVRASDIQKIPFASLEFNINGYACLGDGKLTVIDN